MYKINCKEMTGENCDWALEGENKEELKNKYYAHGAESEIHKEKYATISDEEKMVFGKKLDEHLDTQK